MEHAQKIEFCKSGLANHPRRQLSLRALNMEGYESAALSTTVWKTIVLLLH